MPERSATAAVFASSSASKMRFKVTVSLLRLMLAPFARTFSLADGEVLGCTPTGDSAFVVIISFHFLLKLREPKRPPFVVSHATCSERGSSSFASNVVECGGMAVASAKCALGA